jgi:hypothetical protein
MDKSFKNSLGLTTAEGKFFCDLYGEAVDTSACAVCKLKPDNPYILCSRRELPRH